MEMTMGMRIRECRVKMRMTQEELAEAIYTKKCTISAYETGKIDIKVSILRDIAKILNTTAGYFLHGNESIGLVTWNECESIRIDIDIFVIHERFDMYQSRKVDTKNIVF